MFKVRKYSGESLVRNVYEYIACYYLYHVSMLCHQGYHATMPTTGSCRLVNDVYKDTTVNKIHTHCLWSRPFRLWRYKKNIQQITIAQFMTIFVQHC